MTIPAHLAINADHDRHRFDPSAHVLLQEELKHLYTAITRAKSNVSYELLKVSVLLNCHVDSATRCGLACIVHGVELTWCWAGILHALSSLHHPAGCRI
jgi:hypothetical protein